MTSLRERKKAETRQRIADVATAMFIERGFDDVTTTEIAEAAGVSKVTVFNYFQRKEDIFFDRQPQAVELLTTALRDRGEQTPLQALRALFVELAREGHPLGGFRDRYVRFWQTVLASPALRARAREAIDELTADIADLIPDDPHPRLTAALAMAAFRTAFTAAATRVLAGEPADVVTPDYITALDHAFDTLAGGLE